MNDVMPAFGQKLLACSVVTCVAWALWHTVIDTRQQRDPESIFPVSGEPIPRVESTFAELGDFSKIEKVIIEEHKEGGISSEMVVEKHKIEGPCIDSEQWTLPLAFDFPASRNTVSSFFQSLKAGRAESLADYSAGKLIRLYDESQRETRWYMSDDSQLSTKTDDWIDHNLIKLKPEDISAISLNGIEISKDKSSWTLPGWGKSSSRLQSVARNLVDVISNMSVKSVIGTKRSNVEDIEDLSFDVTLGTNYRVKYRLSKPKNQTYTQLTISEKVDKPWIFKLEDSAALRTRNAIEAARLEIRALTGYAGR